MKFGKIIETVRKGFDSGAFLFMLKGRQEEVRSNYFYTPESSDGKETVKSYGSP